MPTTVAAPGVPGDKLLRALGRYRLLTRRQSTRLLYRETSTTFVGEHLTRLTRAGYLEMMRIPLHLPIGGTPGIWTLRERGRRYLLDVGLEIPPLAAPPTSSPHLWHLLSLNDALIALDLVCDRDEGLVLEALRHDLDLRRMAPRVTLPTGRQTSVIPDAWIDLLVDEVPMGIAFELDMGTEGEPRWGQKLEGLLALAAGPYQQLFGASSMTVAVLTTAGDRRLATLRRWTARFLDERDLKHWQELFWFAAADPALTDPAALYQGKRWRLPLDPLPRALLAPAHS
jgi:Replication-relaxation